MATLLLSTGVPMICGGDELSHTQNGNNNAYCQDNELTWLNWELDESQQRFLDFVREVCRIRAEEPVFQRRKFFLGRSIRGSGITDISWFNPAGTDMTDDDWGAGFVKCMGVRLAGDLIGDMDERGEPIRGDTLLLLVNAHHEAIPFTLPATKPGHQWERLLDTAERRRDEELLLQGGEKYPLRGRSLVLLRTWQPDPPDQHSAGEALRRDRRRKMPPAVGAATGPLT